MVLGRSNGPVYGVSETRLTQADNNDFIEIIDGDKFNSGFPSEPDNPLITFNCVGCPNRLSLDERMLSTHVMVLGDIGTGKSNTFYHMIDQVSRSMTDNDVMLIFDTKGDFLRKFGTSKDVVISNDSSARGPYGPDYWNVFNEIDKDNVEEDIREMCASLFKESVKNSSNSYFPNAAADLLFALMYMNSLKRKSKPNNKQFIRFLKSSDVGLFHKLFENHPEFRYVSSHISDPNSGQTQGVVAEMNSVVNRVFVGNFAKDGTLSIRKLIRERGGRKIFIEYDLNSGEVLTPIYNLLVDMAIKEALSKKSSGQGSVYIFVDEFKLLPHLSHIDDAVNFGRSLGVKMTIGLQSITQLYDNYGESKAKSILSGFLNKMFFRVNNYESKTYIKEYFGTCIEKIRYEVQGGMGDHVMVTDVVKDKYISRLGVGQAIIVLPGCEPFIFSFDEWRDS